MKNDYLEPLNKVKGVVDPSIPLVSNLSNISSILYDLGDVNWAGFYLSNKEYLYLGPFQGEVACTRIPFDKGVCGAAFTQKKTIIVDDVNTFKGHIACSSKSRSEIVTPIIKDDKVLGVIDIDSPIYSRFSSDEQELLEAIAKIISSL